MPVSRSKYGISLQASNPAKNPQMCSVVSSWFPYSFRTKKRVAGDRSDGRNHEWPHTCLWLFRRKMEAARPALGSMLLDDETILFSGRPVKNIRDLKADHRKPRNARKKAAFLRAFGNNFSITKSARLVGIDRTTHYEWLAKDAKYKAAFERKVLMRADEIKDGLARLALTGVFKPVIYKGRFCYAPRIRILCELADGTSAFQDELPKGAKVTGSRMVTTYDGEMIGSYKRNWRALSKLLSVTLPEKYGNVLRRERKPRAR